MSSLSLSGCQLCDEQFRGLKELLTPGVLVSLNDVNLSRNPELTLQSVSDIIDMTTGWFVNFILHTGRARLIQSLSLARISFELIGNLN